MINVALFGFGRIGQMHAENLTKNKEIKLLYIKIYRSGSISFFKISIVIGPINL